MRSNEVIELGIRMGTDGKLTFRIWLILINKTPHFRASEEHRELIKFLKIF